MCIICSQAHAVDSSELAFKIAAQNAFAAGFMAAKPGILEPIMAVEVSAPHEYQVWLCVSRQSRQCA